MSCKRVNGEGTSPLLEASADPCGHLCLLEETNGNQIDDFFTVLLDRIDRTDLSEGNIETPAGNLEDEFYSFQVVRVKPVGDCHETGMEIIESSQRSELQNIESTEMNISTTETKGIRGKGCNCKFSKCSKNYCDCFKLGLSCSSSCSCLTCMNKSTVAVLKLCREDSEEGVKVKKGCHCKNSQCAKNYCECFHNGESCSEHCRCVSCYNKSQPTLGRKKVKTDPLMALDDQTYHKNKFSVDLFLI